MKSILEMALAELSCILQVEQINSSIPGIWKSTCCQVFRSSLLECHILLTQEQDITLNGPLA